MLAQGRLRAWATLSHGVAHVPEITVHPHNVPTRLVGSLDGPSKTIIVEPLRVPATQPVQPVVAPERDPKRSEPGPEREPAPGR